MAMKCADCRQELMDDETYVCAACDRRHQQHADEYAEPSLRLSKQ